MAGCRLVVPFIIARSPREASGRGRVSLIVETAEPWKPPLGVILFVARGFPKCLANLVEVA